MPKTISGNKIAVEGVEAGGVFPMSREELLKDIVIEGKKGAFEIQGGVYSRNLLIQGGGSVRGPVFAGENLRLEYSVPKIKEEEEPQYFLAGLFAGRSIVSTVLSQIDVHEGPAADIKGIRFVIRGDIRAVEKVNLRNALVIGSIFAPSVEIHSCIVFGSIIATKFPGDIRATCSTFGLYRSKSVTIEGPTTFLVAGGMSDKAPDIKDFPCPETECDYPGALRLYSLCRLSGVGCGEPGERPKNVLENGIVPNAESGRLPGISCPYWLNRTCAYSDNISLYATDFIEMTVDPDIQRATSDSEDIRSEQDAQAAEPGSGKRIAFVLNAQSRALHLDWIKGHEEELNAALHKVFAYEHARPEIRSLIKKSIIGEPAKHKTSGDRLDKERLSTSQVRLLRMAIEKLDNE